jgi:hypothetical protein
MVVETYLNPRRLAAHSNATRSRISQLLAVAETDPATVEADLYHEFGLSLEEAIRLIRSHYVRRRNRSQVPPAR